MASIVCSLNKLEVAMVPAENKAEAVEILLIAIVYVLSSAMILPITCLQTLSDILLVHSVPHTPIHSPSLESDVGVTQYSTTPE